ncbi:hypothetical protein ADL27_32315 [Streptomyces sp. NRRL F-6602]|nr:hypothetical protein ADL27_32315 [Streptomyces sp. NRRL F-6602]
MTTMPDSYYEVVDARGIAGCEGCGCLFDAVEVQEEELRDGSFVMLCDGCWEADYDNGLLV